MPDSPRPWFLASKPLVARLAWGARGAILPLALAVGPGAEAAELPKPEARYVLGNVMAGVGLAMIAGSGSALLLVHYNCADSLETCAMLSIVTVGMGVLPGVGAVSLGTAMSYSGAQRFGGTPPSLTGAMVMAGGTVLMVATRAVIAGDSDWLPVAVGMAAITTTAAGAVGQLTANRAAVKAHERTLTVSPWATEETRGLAVGLRW